MDQAGLNDWIATSALESKNSNKKFAFFTPLRVIDKYTHEV